MIPLFNDTRNIVAFKSFLTAAVLVRNGAVPDKRTSGLRILGFGLV